MSRLFALPFIATVALLLDAGLACAQPTNTTEVTSLTFTPDGKSVLATSLDGTLRRWGPSDGKEKQRVTAHKGGVYGGALSADGKRFATAGGDGSARLWDAVTLKELRAFQGHRGEVVAVALTPDGKMLATGGADKTIRLWDADTGKASGSSTAMRSASPAWRSRRTDDYCSRGALATWSSRASSSTPSTPTRRPCGTRPRASRCAS